MLYISCCGRLNVNDTKIIIIFFSFFVSYVCNKSVSELKSVVNLKICYCCEKY